MSAGAHAYDQAPAEYLALGDSYTIGEGVEDSERWPTRLAAALRARGIAIAHPHYIARSGWTTDELAGAIDEEQSQRQLLPGYGLVSLQIGVNDQYRERDLGSFQLQFSALLERGLVALDARQFDEAERWLRRALAQKPDEPDINYSLSECLREAGKDAEAAHYHKKFLELDAGRHR